MLSVNGGSVDVKKHEVKVAGEIVTLTLKEFELLERLMRNQNIVLTRDQLLEDIEPLKKNQYGHYLMDVLAGKYIDIK